MNEFLFVYGTLLPGHAPEEISAAAARLQFLCEATVAGELYDLGLFPGAVLCDHPGHEISGSIFQLPHDNSTLDEIDRYEEFDPPALQRSQFQRVLCQAQTATGQVLPCWIYVYVRDLAGATPIESGAWPRQPSS